MPSLLQRKSDRYEAFQIHGNKINPVKAVKQCGSELRESLYQSSSSFSIAFRSPLAQRIAAARGDANGMQCHGANVWDM